MPALIKEFAYGNIMQVPNREDCHQYGRRAGHQNAKLLDDAVAERLRSPARSRLRRESRAALLRAGQAVGTKVNLRGDRI